MQSLSSKDCIVSANRRTLFVILSFSVADRVEFSGGRKHRTSEPDSISLHEMGNNFDINWNRFNSSFGRFFGECNTVIDSTLDISLKTSSKVFEHGRSSRENNVTVETSTSIDRATLDGLIYNSWKRSEEIRRKDFRIEEELRSKESFVTNIDIVFFFADWLNKQVFFDVFFGLGVVFLVFFDEIRADIRIFFFALLCYFFFLIEEGW